MESIRFGVLSFFCERTKREYLQLLKCIENGIFYMFLRRISVSFLFLLLLIGRLRSKFEIFEGFLIECCLECSEFDIRNSLYSWNI